MARRNVRQSRAMGTGQAFTLPAPYRGLNLRDGRSALPADQARELTNFLPDNGKLTVRPGYVPHSAVTGEDFSDVVLLCNFDGSDGAATSTDQSDSGHTLSFQNGAELDTAQKKFGASSLLLDSSTNDYVQISNSSDFDFGTGPFTVECFVRLPTAGGSGSDWIVALDTVGARGWYLAYQRGTGTFTFAYSSNGSSFPSGQQVAGMDGTAVADTWYHVAADRDPSGVLRLYVDGAQVDSATSTNSVVDTSSDLFIGRLGSNGSAYFDGWIDSIRITKGLARYGGAFTAPTTAFPTDDVTGQVRTLVEHKGVTARKMIAITTEGTAYDVSATAASSLSAAGYADGRFQTANFNGYTFGVNGTDTPWRYDGSSWLATGFTGLTLTNLINVANVRNRLWFCEKDSANVWYGGIGSVTGTLTEFQLSQIASGGYCMAIGSWSRDSGAGADDVTVFIMDTGQVIVYEGDPASTFSLVGKYQAPEPIGRQCTVKIGGELILITKSGFLPVSSIYTGLGDVRAIDVWGVVAPGVEADYKLYGTLEGWHGVFHGGLAYFNVPTSDSAAKQYVLNTRNNAWTTYDYPVYAFSPFGDDLYFSERNVGTIDKQSGITDNGAAITCLMRGGFSYPGGASTNQQYTAMRPNLSAKGSVTGRLTVDPDFAERTLTGDALTIVSGGGGTPWGSPWGSSWGSRATNPESWFTVNGMGRSVGAVLEINTSASDFALDSIDLLARAGNIR